MGIGELDNTPACGVAARADTVATATIMPGTTYGVHRAKGPFVGLAPESFVWDRSTSNSAMSRCKERHFSSAFRSGEKREISCQTLSHLIASRRSTKGWRL